MSHGDLTRARSWKRRIQPKEAYSSPGLLYSEACENACYRKLSDRLSWNVPAFAAKGLLGPKSGEKQGESFNILVILP